MEKGNALRKRNTTRKKLAELASGLASSSNLATFLEKNDLRPSAIIRSLLAQKGIAMMCDTRKVIAMQKYLRLELTRTQLEEVCRETSEGIAQPPKRSTTAEVPAAEPVADEPKLAAAMKQMAEEEHDEE